MASRAAILTSGLSDLSAGVTGTVHYVDAGYHAMGMAISVFDQLKTQ